MLPDIKGLQTKLLSMKTKDVDELKVVLIAVFIQSLVFNHC